MILLSALTVLTKSSYRPGWFILTSWIACWIALAVGCYQEAPSTPHATTDRLIALLEDRDAPTRRTAAESLGKIGDRKAVPFLLRVFHDVDPAVREAAVRGMGRLPALEKETGSELVAMLRDPDPSVRQAAAQALSAVEGMPLLASELADLLASSDVTHRQAAGHALLLVDAGGAVSALSKGARDPDPTVRQWAVAALGESGDIRAAPVLLERMRQDSMASVRTEAAYRLGFVESDSVAVELESLVQNESSLDVKRWAMKKLKESGKGPTSVQRLD